MRHMRPTTDGCPRAATHHLCPIAPITVPPKHACMPALRAFCERHPCPPLSAPSSAIARRSGKGRRAVGGRAMENAGHWTHTYHGVSRTLAAPGTDTPAVRHRQALRTHVPQAPAEPAPHRRRIISHHRRIYSAQTDGVRSSKVFTYDGALSRVHRIYSARPEDESFFSRRHVTCVNTGPVHCMGSLGVLLRSSPATCTLLGLPPMYAP